jgi:hypothetical protein
MNEQLQALQQAIQMLHQLMVTLQDPQAVAVVGTCLQNLVKLQQTMMQPQQGMAQAIAGQLQQQGAGAGAGGQ